MVSTPIAVIALLLGATAEAAQLRATAKAAAKDGTKLPWANLDADGGEEYEEGDEQDSESDPKTFSLSQYEHTDSRDDADVAEDEDFEDDALNHGESDPEDAADEPDDDSFLQVQASTRFKTLRTKLPWANLDADGGEEYEEGDEQDSESDPKTFSLSQYEHTDSRDDADVAEDENFEDDALNHGESDPEDAADESADDDSFLQIRATTKKLKSRAKLPWANLDADGGEEYEEGDEQESESDPKTFSLSQYEHTDSRDDADVAEDEDFEDDELNHGESDPEDAADEAESSDADSFLQVRAATKTTKSGAKLPWANLDADGGEEYEEGDEQDSESDPKTFSLSQYEHTDSRDDADVAEDEDFEDDELNHGESDPEDAADEAESEDDGSFLQVQSTTKTAKSGAKLPWANLDADGGQEYEEGDEQDSESDPKTFSLSQYEHTDSRDDADVAEDEDFEDDELNHGESDPEDAADEADDDSN